MNQALELQRAADSCPRFADLEARQLLGVGAFGAVRLVRHKPSGISYALKALSKARVLQGGQLQHVLNERGALSRLAGNAFLLQLVASYQDATHLYLLTELLQGGELHSLLARQPGKRLPQEQAASEPYPYPYPYP